MKKLFKFLIFSSVFLEGIFFLIFLFPIKIKGASPPCPPAVNCAPLSPCPSPHCCEPWNNECKGGFVPCGRKCDDPETPNICECSPCEPCHLFVMIDKILDFVFFTLVPAIALLMIVIGGAMFLLGSWDPQTLSRAKSVLTSVATGLFIIFSAWLIVNSFFTFIGAAEWRGFKNWFEINCPLTPISFPPHPCL